MNMLTKKLLTLATFVGFIGAVMPVEAQNTRAKSNQSPSSKKKQAQTAVSRKASASQVPRANLAPRAAPTPKSDALKISLAKALDMAQTGQYQAAASLLFSLARRAELQGERAQIKYILGLMLMELKLNQVAAFQFVDVIRMNNLKYKKQAIEKLSIVADDLGDDTLLNYAVSRVDVGDIPSANRDMLYYRIGEIKLKNKEYALASNFFSKVQKGSSYYLQATYNRGLAELEQNRVDTAIQIFRYLLASRSGASVTDTTKVAAQMALARAFYQKQDWDSAIEIYSSIPRDHFMWHDALFEQSWAMLRAARFRSALSNFQSLHSAYYEDFYIPEALLLRGIVYLYICKYDEMEKVLGLYERSYGPVRNKIHDFLSSNREASSYYAEIDKAIAVKAGKDIRHQLKLPYLVLNYLSNQGDVRRALGYLKSLANEKDKIDANVSFRQSGIGQYSLKVISNRSKNTRLLIGDMVKAHLQNMRTELNDLNEQAGFIRYEMINGKKENLKKRIAGTELYGEQIDDKINREFYVNNGYEYYPFQGEYWLDEIGNYHYLGKQSCEQ